MVSVLCVNKLELKDISRPEIVENPFWKTGRILDLLGR